MSGSIEHGGFSKPVPAGEGQSDGARPIGDLRQGLGTIGAAFGTSGIARRTLLYAYVIAAAAGGAVNALHVITAHHEQPQMGLATPMILEGSSWLTSILFLWIVWIAYRLAPLTAVPRWKLLLHVPAALLFSLTHVGGFVVLRKLAYRLAGADYAFGAFISHFGYELGKDLITYALFIAMFALLERLLRQQSAIHAQGQPPTFDIRDGAKLTRVRLDEVLAVTSAGNYVEFVLIDGRRLLMRSPLSRLEHDLEPHGFLRTHRSWLVNASRVTALKPAGSGDYALEVASVTVPLSRRFPAALARLRNA